MTTLDPRGALQRSLLVWGGAAALAAGPILAMGLVSEPNELVFIGAIVACIGVGYEIATRLPARLAYAAGLATGYWHSTTDISDNWGIDKRWRPAMEESRREQLFAAWNKAVSRSLDWAV